MTGTTDRPVEPGYVRRIFDRIAPYYDPMNTIISFGQHRRWKRLTVDRAGTLEPGGKALDLCCGSGDLTLIAARQAGTEGKVVGLDFSQNMLDVARERVEREEVPAKIDLIEGDATDLSRFRDEMFQLVTMGFGLRNLAEPVASLHESLRVLKPGGALAILDMSKPVAAWMRPFYWVYLYLIMPVLALLFTGSREEYCWLSKSLSHHPSRGELTGILEEVGFAEVECYSLAGGVAAIHIARKAAPEKLTDE